ncbi:MAG: hypothetical protein WC806_04555 [Candidatus Gracilibacteria bacterium]|jgi:ABC-type glycerol-3-phosphate transport system substrate-binding protein
MKKFFLALALTGLATLSLAGCAGNEAVEETATPEVTEEEVVAPEVTPPAEEVVPAAEAAPTTETPVAE